MKKITGNVQLKFLIGLLSLGALLISVFMGPIVGSLTHELEGLAHRIRPTTREMLHELDRLELLERMSSENLSQLISYQAQTGKSLAEILKEPIWCEKMGLSTNQFKVTWYMANPYELLPPKLQDVIRKRKGGFRDSKHLWQWCRLNKFPWAWRRALNSALIETTPENLWRASQGKRPYTKNGDFLEPIVIDHGDGQLEVRDGHIATDPRVIPTNSVVFLLVKIDGEDRVLRVVASDIGGAIKGKHVDLPVHLGPSTRKLPYTLLPSSLRNKSVQILKPVS